CAVDSLPSPRRRACGADDRGPFQRRPAHPGDRPGNRAGAGNSLTAVSPQSSSLRPAAGIGLLLLSTWALSGLDASGKWAMGLGVPLLVLSWVRYIVHLALVAALVLPLRGTRVMRSRRTRDQILRGMFMLL